MSTFLVALHIARPDGNTRLRKANVPIIDPSYVFPVEVKTSADRVRGKMMELGKDEKERVTAGCVWSELSWDGRLAKIQEVLGEASV